MKRKIISVVLCVVLAFSTLGIASAANTITDSGSVTNCVILSTSYRATAQTTSVASYASTKLTVTSSSFIATTSATFTYVYYQNSGTISAGTCKSYTNSSTISCDKTESPKTAKVAYVPPVNSSVVQVYSSHTVKNSSGLTVYSKSINN